MGTAGCRCRTPRLLICAYLPTSPWYGTKQTGSFGISNYVGISVQRFSLPVPDSRNSRQNGVPPDLRLRCALMQSAKAVFFSH